MVFEMLKVLILLIFTIFFGIVLPELAAADASSSGAPETVPPKQKTAAAKKHEPTAKGETLKLIQSHRSVIFKQIFKIVVMQCMRSFDKSHFMPFQC